MTVDGDLFDVRNVKATTESVRCHAAKSNSVNFPSEASRGELFGQTRPLYKGWFNEQMTRIGSAGNAAEQRFSGE